MNFQFKEAVSKWPHFSKQANRIQRELDRRLVIVE